MDLEIMIDEFECPEDEENFDDMCRLCGNSSDQLIPIFTAEGIEHALADKIREHLPLLQVLKHDSFPSNICYQCASTLLSWHELYHASIGVEKRLIDLSNNLRTKGQTNIPECTETFEESTLDDLSSKTEPVERIQNVNWKLERASPEAGDERYSLNSVCSSDSNSRDENSIFPPNFNSLDIPLLVPRSDVAEVTTGREITPDLVGEEMPPLAAKLDVTSELQQAPKCRSPSDKQFECTDCSRRFANSVTWVVHLNEGRIIRANPSIFSLEYKAGRRHSETPDTGSQPLASFECDHCHKKFTRKCHLRAHIRFSHTDEKSFACDCCEWRCVTECDLAMHRSVHTLNERLVCRRCGGRQRCSTRPHDNDVILLRCVCSHLIPLSAPDEAGLVPDEGQPQCRVKKLIRSQPLTMFRRPSRGRVKKVQKKDNGWWEKAFDNVGDLDELGRVRKTICEHCNKNCGSYYNLKRHNRLHSERIECKVCGKLYLKSYLKLHMQIHAKVKAFVCDKCGKRFAQNSSLRAHKLLEDNVKKLMCNICGMRFVLSSRLQLHLKTHLDSKPFKCDDCDREYGYVWQLRQHRIKHSDAREYTCESCAKCYKTMKHLRQHWHNYPDHRQIA